MITEGDLEELGFTEFTMHLKSTVATGKSRTVVFEAIPSGMRFQYPKETPPPFFVTKFRPRGRSGVLFVDVEGRTFLASRIFTAEEVARLVRMEVTEVVDGMRVGSF
jgi:hypothetical protein